MIKAVNALRTWWQYGNWVDRAWLCGTPVATAIYVWNVFDPGPYALLAYTGFGCTIIGLVVMVKHRPWVPPVPPDNVQFHRANGTAIPLDCRYVGRYGGVDIWQAIVPASLWPEAGDHITFSVLPPRTLVTMEFSRTRPRDAA